MMAAKISAGVAPDVHLKDQLHADSKACKWGIYLGFVKADLTRRPKQWYQWPHNKE